jgi:hypothetical protein
MAATNDDCADALPEPQHRRKQWRAVWKRARDKTLPRELRGFAWLLLHGALSCGGAKVAFAGPARPELPDAVCCSHAVCRGAQPPPPAAPAAVGQRRGRDEAAAGAGPESWPLETLLHALLECPAVRPALQWLAALWPRFDGDAPPPLTPEVWLQDSPAAWRPRAGGEGGAQRWAHMRLAVLEAAWRLRCRRHFSDRQFSAADVVGDVIDSVQRRVRADWQRTSQDVTVVAGTSPSWFAQSRPPLSQGGFADVWCAGGVIARLVPAAAGPAARPRLVLCFEACRLGPATPAAAGPSGGSGGASGSGAGGSGSGR